MSPGQTARMLAVRYADWPLTAAGVPADVSAVVVAANEVVVASAAARASGVRVGLRRREAQARCPELVVVAADPDRDARVFEPVAATVDTVVPGVEVSRPGVCVVASKGAARYFGGDEAVVEQVRQALAQVHPGGRAVSAVPGIGVADGPFAATVAAADSQVVTAGASAQFLAPFPVELLDRPDLADLLRRLGLSTLGRFAALPAADVLARFGPRGALAHRLARGIDDRPLLPRDPPPDLAVSTELDPPAEHSDQVAFAARRLAEQAQERLVAAGLACSRILVEAETTHGQRLGRFWRHDGPLSVAAVTDRIRWQIDGWLSGSAAAVPATAEPAARPVEGPVEGVVSIRLVPDQLLAADGRQLGLWGEAGGASGRVERAVSRVQGLLGPAGALTARLGGGRDPASRVQLTPWGDPAGPEGNRELPWGPDGGSRSDLTGVMPVQPGVGGSWGSDGSSGRRGRSAGLEGERQPWPGRLPSPSPATVPVDPVPAVVTDMTGVPVGVDGRCAVTGEPATLSVAGGPAVRVTGWAGPWPVDERWWDGAGRRRARFQMTTDDGVARLLAVHAGRWWVEATYD